MLAGCTWSNSVSIAMINWFDSAFGAVSWLLDVEVWLLLVIFIILDCHFTFFASIFNLSRMNVLIIFYCTPQHDRSLLECVFSRKTIIILLCCSFAFFTDAGKPDDFVDNVACKMEENSFLSFCEVRCCSVHRHQLFDSD